MTQENKLSLLLVYGKMDTGGIETLIVRMSNWLVERGHEVTLLIFESGDLVNLLDKRVKVDVIDINKILFFIPVVARNYLSKYKNTDIDVIYSFGPEACYIAAYVAKSGFQKPRPAFLNGIYHPNEFALSGGKSPLDNMHIELYNNYINDNSKIFMSEQVRSGNEKILGKSVPDARIWPLPVDGSRFVDIERKIIPYKIVSIGRFADFKTYNLYMFDVVKKLYEMGYDVTWDIYGYGPLEKEMRRLMQEKGLSDRVFMKGSLLYENMSSVLAEAHVFVGVGTAIIEAGFFGIPSVPGIQNDMEAVTYGSLYDLPYYSCGEILPEGTKTIPVIQEIKRIFDMSESEYEEEARMTREYVRPYSIDDIMSNFLEYAVRIKDENGLDAYPNWKFYLYGVNIMLSQIRRKLGIKRKIRILASSLNPNERNRKNSA